MKSTKINLQNLSTQVNLFIDRLEKYSKDYSKDYSEKNYKFLRDFYIKFFEDRNRRAMEVASPRYSIIKELAISQFSGPTLWDLCMDGRVLAILVNGASAGVGSSVRVPGGILREFVRGRDGKMKLINDSNFARLIDRAFAKYNTEIIYEVFDSHIGCAARKAEELAHGYEAEDSGLLSDVVNKKELCLAVKEYVAQRYNGGKKIVTIQTSFDPHTGYIYMGLDTEEALAFAKKNNNVYTKKVLIELIEKKLIISAEDLTKDPKILNVFEKYKFNLDWKNNYVKSAEIFWKNIAKMKKILLPIVSSYIKKIYPKLYTAGDDKKELEERAMLILTNAYSGFLNNHIVEGELEHNYPYGVHREEGVKVSEGGYPPYEISMFVVFSMDRKNLPSNIELASSLVRSNRRDGRIVDRSKTFKEISEFVMAPVPVVVQALVRDVSGREWDDASRIDWSDMPEKWDKMDATDFYAYLQKKMNMSISLANGINRLREKMIVLYDPDNPTSSHLIEQYKVAMPVVVGKNRQNYFIVPFVKLGFL